MNAPERSTAMNSDKPKLTSRVSVALNFIALVEEFSPSASLLSDTKAEETPGEDAWPLERRITKCYNGVTL